MIDFPTPLETALSYIRIFNARDPIALRNLYRDDFLAENPRWAKAKTVDEVVAAIQHVWTTLPSARCELKNVIADGEVVALEFLWVWTDDRPQARATNGGRPVDHRVPIVDVFHVRDGKLAALRAYQDPERIEAALAVKGDRTSPV